MLKNNKYFCFAGMDCNQHLIAAQYLVRNPSVLTSFIKIKTFFDKPTILKSLRIKLFTDLKNKSLRILDSGAFTFINSAMGVEYDRSFYINYFEKYFEFINKSKEMFDYYVELDLQSLNQVGYKLVEEWRTKFHKRYGDKIIYVWHIIDGTDRLKELSKKYNYIGLSVPEINSKCINSYQTIEFINTLTKIIKKNNPTGKIHLLGCARFDILESNKDYYSCDSTTWYRQTVYGAFKSRLKGFELYTYFGEKGKVAKEWTPELKSFLQHFSNMSNKYYENLDLRTIYRFMFIAERCRYFQSNFDKILKEYQC